MHGEDDRGRDSYNANKEMRMEKDIIKKPRTCFTQEMKRDASLSYSGFKFFKDLSKFIKKQIYFLKP
jgi:hypothetical protein